MPTTDRELPQVVVNKLTQAQYNAATKSADEFYLVTDAKVTGDDINLNTIVSAGVWTTTESLPAIASSTSTTIDVSSLGFSSADEYAVMAFNLGGGNNSPFVSITVDPKTATSFTLRVWNAHWSGGAIGTGLKVQWFVIRVA